MTTSDLISPQEAKTLAGLLSCRVARTPDLPAYRYYRELSQDWGESSWSQVAQQAALWQQALQQEDLQPGDRVAIMLKNCLEWVLFDLAANGLGLVTVPLYVNDRAENLAYSLNTSEAKLLLTEGLEQWQTFEQVGHQIPSMQRVVTLHSVCEQDCDPRLRHLVDWLPSKCDAPYRVAESDIDSLATIVFTSGTTGQPKGVMLSQRNILENAAAGAVRVMVLPDDQFLSFLPLSHMLERTVGYYIPLMTGACVAFVRSIDQLADDLQIIKPTILISVPRIFERIFNKMTLKLAEESWISRKIFQLAVSAGWHHFQYHRKRQPWAIQLLIWPLLKRAVGSKLTERLGGRLRFAICGGAPLSPQLAETFIGLGVPILQGYGMTETSPVVSVNTLEDNLPLSVGKPLPGVEVRIGEHQELLVKGPNVMLGYWQQKDSIIAADGWLHTGDQARLDKQGRIFITGRIKDIIVLSSGEKVPPEDLQMAIAIDPLFEQVLVLGEQRPFLSAIVVLNPSQWQRLAKSLAIDSDDKVQLNSVGVKQQILEKISYRLKAFPGYAKVHQVYVAEGPWSIESGLLTAALKLRRLRIVEKFSQEIETMYLGH